MPRPPALPRQYDVLTDDRGSRKTHLRAQHRVLADFTAMPVLHQVVDLCAAPDSRLADTGPVYTGIRLDLHVTFDDRRSRLRNLLPLFLLVLGKAKSVCSDDCTILE